MDEDCQAKPLVKMLKKAGHNVITVNEAGLSGQQDSIVFEYAIKESRIIITYNCEDFQRLHEINPNHYGILAIYKDQSNAKNMSRSVIVQAIAP